MGMAVDLSPMGLTEDLITAAGDGLWDQLKMGLMTQMAGANLLKDEVVQYKGKNALYLEIDGAGSSAPQLKGKKAFGYLFLMEPSFTKSYIIQQMLLLKRGCNCIL